MGDWINIQIIKSCWCNTFTLMRKKKNEPKIIVVKYKGKKPKYHKSKLKLNKDGSITVYE